VRSHDSQKREGDGMKRKPREWWLCDICFSAALLSVDGGYTKCLGLKSNPHIPNIMILVREVLHKKRGKGNEQGHIEHDYFNRVRV
jgi:hypothetical protein